MISPFLTLAESQMTDDKFDDHLRFITWCSKQPKRNTGLYEAISVFKDELYGICIDKLASGEDKTNFQDILNKMRNDKKLDVERAKAYPMHELMRQYGLESRRGQYQCPFHEDRTPSMSIHKPSNRFKCFACNESGDTIDFIQKMDKCSFVDACKKLT